MPYHHLAWISLHLVVATISAMLRVAPQSGSHLVHAILESPQHVHGGLQSVPYPEIDSVPNLRHAERFQLKVWVDDEAAAYCRF